MDFSRATAWWVAAGIAVAAELAAAIVGGGATAAWHWHRRGSAATSAPSERNRDVNLDIGERVRVATWGSDRTTRVTYRGSTWTARLQPGATPVPGEHVVAAVEGNWLVLAPSPF